jgi:hypothetical protein
MLTSAIVHCSSIPTNCVHRRQLFPATHHRQSAGSSCRWPPSSHLLTTTTHTTKLMTFSSRPCFADYRWFSNSHCIATVIRITIGPRFSFVKGLIQDGWDLDLLCIGSADTQSPPSSTHVTLTLGHHLFFLRLVIGMRYCVQDGRIFVRRS